LFWPLGDMCSRLFGPMKPINAQGICRKSFKPRGEELGEGRYWR
jgi:hypothetical protein